MTTGIHRLGGPSCGEPSPFYSDEVCSRKADHVYARGKDKLHHTRGTTRKWGAV